MVKRYRVLVDGLCYPTDSRIIRRILSGEDIPLGKRGMCEPHQIGDLVSDVPQASIVGLVKAGWIEEVIIPDDET